MSVLFIRLPIASLNLILWSVCLFDFLKNCIAGTFKNSSFKTNAWELTLTERKETFDVYLKYSINQIIVTRKEIAWSNLIIKSKPVNRFFVQTTKPRFPCINNSTPRLQRVGTRKISMVNLPGKSLQINPLLNIFFKYQRELRSTVS